MSRAEFSKRTKLLAFQASGGRCQKCTARLMTGRIEYHHDKECAFGGTADLENCVVLCTGCHAEITSERAAVIAKSNRVRSAHLGIKRTSSRPMPCGKQSRFKKRMDGSVVLR